MNAAKAMIDNLVRKHGSKAEKIIKDIQAGSTDKETTQFIVWHAPSKLLAKFYAEFGSPEQHKQLLDEFHKYATDMEEAKKLGDPLDMRFKYKNKYNQLVKQLKKKNKTVPKPYDTIVL